MFQRNSNQILLSLVLDLLCLTLAIQLAMTFRNLIELGPQFPGVEDLPPPIIFAIFSIWMLTFFGRGIYSLKRPLRPLSELFSIVFACHIALLLLAGVLYFSYRDVSRFVVLYFHALSLLGLLGWRILGRILLARFVQKRRAIVIGRAQENQSLIEALQHQGFQIIANLAMPQADALQQCIRQESIDDVIIGSPMDADNLRNSVLALESLPVQVYIAPDYVNLALHQARIETLGMLPLIALRAPAIDGYKRIQKRSFDLFLTLCFTPFLLPLTLLIALLVWLMDGHPIIYRQTRIGENAKPFTMYKFRTMIPNAEHHEPSQKQRHDPRVTRLGAFLRRTSLDELPQFWNILRGDMSLVGPRPEVPSKVALYSSWQRKRFAVPQGLTGWWQVHGRSDKPMHLHTEEDLYYIRHYSLWLDISILLRTVLVVFTGRGAF